MNGALGHDSAFVRLYCSGDNWDKKRGREGEREEDRGRERDRERQRQRGRK